MQRRGPRSGGTIALGSVALRPVALAIVLLLPVACGGSAAPSQQPQAVTSASTAATAEITGVPSPSGSPALVKVTPIAGAPDSGTVVSISVRGAKWSVYTMEAPAGEVWHVTIDQQDPPPGRHNFDVSSGPAFGERIFTSPLMSTLGSFTWVIPALPAGTYLFICTVHPAEMTGTLTIR